jgi:hypothetical protein
MRHKIFAAFTAIAFTLSMSSVTMADQKCKDTKIKVTNSYKAGNNKVQIKILAINYYDKEDGKWRTNNLSNKTINYGKTGSVTEDLEYVGDEWVKKIQIKFKYKEDKGWSSTKWSNVKSFSDHDCAKGRTYSITIDGTTSQKK